MKGAILTLVVMMLILTMMATLGDNIPFHLSLSFYLAGGRKEDAGSVIYWHGGTFFSFSFPLHLTLLV
jgi:hypothetical protein